MVTPLSVSLDIGEISNELSVTADELACSNGFGSGSPNEA